MAKKKTVKAGARKKAFQRRIITTALVFLVLYIGAQVISRTEGMRKAVADKISNGTRLPVSLDHCGATLLVGLRLEGLVLPGVELPDVKMSFNWFSFLSKDKPFVRVNARASPTSARRFSCTMDRLCTASCVTRTARSRTPRSRR